MCFVLEPEGVREGPQILQNLCVLVVFLFLYLCYLAVVYFRYSFRIFEYLVFIICVLY